MLDDSFLSNPTEFEATRAIQTAGEIGCSVGILDPKTNNRRS